jgi:hypothetical protein
MDSFISQYLKDGIGSRLELQMFYEAHDKGYHFPPVKIRITIRKIKTFIVKPFYE